MPKSLNRILLLCLLFFSLIAKGRAQTNSKEEAKQLYAEIAKMDSLLFNAFNTRDIAGLKKYFASDLEVYQDNTGLRNYSQTIASFTDLFAKDYVLTRELVKNSMEVYPVKDFGAIQTGSHRFCHVENGKLQCGTFKFMHIWQKTGEGWKIRRLVTYDH
ncbi:MAG: nuclear transport factor 2 family protein [Bacteroidota bacterium]